MLNSSQTAQMSVIVMSPSFIAAACEQDTHKMFSSNSSHQAPFYEPYFIYQKSYGSKGWANTTQREDYLELAT